MAIKLIKPNVTHGLVLGWVLLAIGWSYLPFGHWAVPAALGVAIWSVAAQYGQRLAKLESELAALRSEQVAAALVALDQAPERG